MKVFLIDLSIVIMGFLAPIEGMLLATLGLVIADLITGILASIKAKIPITSYGFKRTVVKLCVYELCIILAHVVGTYLTGPTIPVLHLASSLIGLTELKSVYENLNNITGGSLLSALISAIQKLSSNDPS